MSASDNVSKIKIATGRTAINHAANHVTSHTARAIKNVALNDFR